MTGLLHCWRANFLTGLAIVLPAVLSVADGIKFMISLGAISPEALPGRELGPQSTPQFTP